MNRSFWLNLIDVWHNTWSIFKRTYLLRATHNKLVPYFVKAAFFHSPMKKGVAIAICFRPFSLFTTIPSQQQNAKKCHQSYVCSLSCHTYHASMLIAHHAKMNFYFFSQLSNLLWMPKWVSKAVRAKIWAIPWELAYQDNPNNASQPISISVLQVSFSSLFLKAFPG